MRPSTTDPSSDTRKRDFPLLEMGVSFSPPSSQEAIVIAQVTV